MRFAAFAALTTVLASPATAEIIELKEGDVYCAGYDEKSESCATVQTMKELGEGRYQFVDLSGFAFNAMRLDMVSTFVAVEKDGKICVEEDGFKISIEPKTSKLAEGWQNMMQYQMDEMSAKDYCFEHEKCMDEWVAIGSLGGERQPNMSLTFRVFPADDPRAKTVQPRYLSVEDFSKMQNEIEDKCFPKDA